MACFFIERILNETYAEPSDDFKRIQLPQPLINASKRA